MSLVIQASGLKGAAPRRLKQAVEQHMAEVGDRLTPEHRACVTGLQLAANKLIARAPKGMQIDVQLLFTDTPFGGVDMSVAVAATRPRSR